MEQKITLRNGSRLALTDKAIAIGREKLAEAPGENLYPLLRDSEGAIIPAQLDDLNGDQVWDELFFVASLPPQSRRSFVLSWSKESPPGEPRTNIVFGKRRAPDKPVQPQRSDTLYAGQLPKSLGYQPYQTDGPSWENDKVGFRHYLDGRNAKDLFGKRVAAMALGQVGLSPQGAVVDNYHVLEPWGRDILAVGNSAGLGGMALLVGQQLERLGVTAADSVNNVEETYFKVLTGGPVRAAMSFQYKNWHTTGDRVYQVQETTSIWPGMYAFQNSYQLKNLQGDETLLIGLVNSNTGKRLTEVVVDDKWVVLMTHDKQTYNKEYWLGLALILPRDIYLGYGKAPASGNFSNSYYGKLKIQNDQPVTYYAVGCWELSDPGFKDPVYFTSYVQNLARQLGTPVQVEIK